MQWNDGAYAGFSASEPWIGVNPNYPAINVEQALADPDSVLHYYRQLIRLRKEHPVLVYGRYEYFEDTPDDVFVFQRILDGTTLLVLGNFSAQEQQTRIPTAGNGGEYRLLLGNYPGHELNDQGPTTLRAST